MNKVEICGVNTAKLPVLPNRKMRELLARIKQAMNKLGTKWSKVICVWCSV